MLIYFNKSIKGMPRERGSGWNTRCITSTGTRRSLRAMNLMKAMNIMEERGMPATLR